MRVGGVAGRGWPLVGRNEELALVTQWMADGETRGVLISGAAGTGKTRIIRELTGTTLRDGRPVAQVSATRSTMDIAYGALAGLVPAPEAADPPESMLARGLAELRTRSATHRLLLAIDDIDLLDPMSHALIHRAVAEDLVFLLASTRSQVPVPEPVVTLWKDLGVARMDLQGLSRGETGELLRGALDGEVDAATVHALWSAGHGIPLYLTELTSEAVRSGRLTQTDGVWMATGDLPTPASLVELIELRLADLDHDSIATLEVLAVAERLEHQVLTALGSKEGVERLERAGMIEVEHDGARTIATLHHPIFGEVVRRRLVTARMAEVAAALADEIERHGARRRGDVLQLATWRLTAGAPPDPALMEQAAELAYRSGDFDSAIRFSRLGWDGGSTNAGLLLGQLLHERGDHRQAEAINETLTGVVAPEAATRIAVQRAVNLFFGLGRGAAALDSLTGDAAGLHLNRCWLLVNMGRIDDASHLLERLTSGDPVVERTALVTRAWIEAVGGRTETALAAASAAADIGTVSDGPPSRFRDFPELPHTLALLEHGDLETARRMAEAGLERSIDRHPAFIRGWWLFLLGRIALDQGAGSTAQSWFRQGVAIQRRLSQPGLLRWHLGGLALAACFTTGGEETARVALDEADGIGERDERLYEPLVDQARAWISADGTGREDVARRLAAAAVDLTARGVGSLADRLRHDVGRLGFPELVDWPPDPSTPLGRLRHDHAVALVGGDAEALARVGEGFGSLGLDLIAAEAWLGAERAFRRAGDQRRANRARHTAETHRDACENPRSPGLVAESSITPLTRREREVIGMAAAGMPSKEVAERLFVSVRTVNNLIQRAYQKLGVSSRAEAAEALGIEPR